MCVSTALHWHAHTPVKLETLMSKHLWQGSACLSAMYLFCCTFWLQVQCILLMTRVVAHGASQQRVLLSSCCTVREETWLWWLLRVWFFHNTEWLMMVPHQKLLRLVSWIQRNAYTWAFLSKSYQCIFLNTFPKTGLQAQFFPSCYLIWKPKILTWSLETNDLVQNENMEKRGEGNFLQFNFRP